MESVTAEEGKEQYHKAQAVQLLFSYQCNTMVPSNADTTGTHVKGPDQKSGFI